MLPGSCWSVSKFISSGPQAPEEYFDHEIDGTKHHSRRDEYSPAKDWLSNLPDYPESNSYSVGGNICRCLAVRLSWRLG